MICTCKANENLDVIICLRTCLDLLKLVMVGTGIFFSNAIFCSKFGTALKSKLNELK